MKKQALTIAGVAVCVILVVGALVGVLSMQPAETTTTTTAQPSQPSNPPAGGAMTKAQWEAMINKSNFDNYTLTENQIMKGDYLPGGIQKVGAVFRVASGNVEIDTYQDDVLIGTKKFTGAEAVEQKEVSFEVFYPILGDFDKLNYNTDLGCYTNIETITTEVTTEQMGLEVKVVLVIENIKIWVSNNRIVSAAYNGSHTTTVTGMPSATATATIDGTWEFTNYGTTVID